MKKRMVSLLLAVSLCLCVIWYIPMTAYAYTPSDDDITDAVLVIFRCKEGTYDSVNRNDNGALSIGKLQWHGARALELMKEIAGRDPALAQSVLGDGLYWEIVNAGSDAWYARTLTSEEAACFSSLLNTDLSRGIQDALGRKDISDYILRARRLNIHDPAAIVYYCDLQNQYGPAGAEGLLQKVKSRLDQNVILSVEELHTTLLQVTANYHSRRNWVYAYCSALDWMNLGAYTDFGDYGLPAAPVIDPNLDLQPPEINSAEVFCLSPGVFQVELKATDNRELKDCRVEVGSDVSSDAEVALYGKCTDNIWITRVVTDRFSDAAAKYFITVTMSDTSGNGTSTRLEVTRTAMDSARLDPDDAQHTHSFRPLFETKATALSPARRVEQCSECHVLHTVVLSPAAGLTE